MLQFVNSSSKNLKVVQLFKVYDAIGDYRTSSHPYKIGFFHATFVAKPNDFPSEVPEKYLADYTEISGGKADNSHLVDVIGQIGRYAKQVYNYSMSNMPTMIICVSSLLLKSGNWVEFNPNFTQPNMDLVDQFKTSLPNDSLALANNDSTQWSVGTATSVRAKFFVLNEKRTIREIIDSTLVYKLNSPF
ncbi:BnaC05g37070D [Brassica napus]|uniref:BnaC05g37070D protein n=1 Tax=Brassica napus TaxID=3708 RepID=A0A078GUI2_BRANA|nr:BnaC05g37070D [Brassica napus]